MTSALTLAHEALDVETPCRSHEPELWFSDVAEDIATAQRLCRSCPLRTACLAGAVERREPWGVWGGELFERGVIVARRRPKGRPRKDDVVAAAEAADALVARLAEVLDDPDVELELVVMPAPESGGFARQGALAVPVPRGAVGGFIDVGAGEPALDDLDLQRLLDEPDEDAA